MSELREAAEAVVSQAEEDDDFDGNFIDYLVPFEAIEALRVALSGVPEGAASERPGSAECLFTGGHLWESEPGGRCLKCSPPRPVPSPEPLDVERLDAAMARVGAHIDLHRPKDSRPPGCESCAKGIAAIAREYARLAAPQPVPEDET